MKVIYPVGGSALVSSEKQFLKHIDDTGGVLVVNAEIPDRKRYNTTREFDGVLMLPTGVFTVEVKGTGARGELRTPGIDGWSIGGDRSAFHGRPGKQAVTQAKILASLFQADRMQVGQVNGIVAIVGRSGVTLPSNAEVHFVEKVHVVVSGPGVGALIDAEVHGEHPRRRVTIESVERILRVLGGAQSTPPRDQLAAQGFLTEDQLAAVVYAEQEEARAADTALSSMTPAPKPKPSQTVAERPAADRDRFEASRATDRDLTEVVEIVEGVAFSRAAFAKSVSERVGIVSLAGIVNNPIVVREGDGGVVAYHFGEDHVVITRGLDGLVLDFNDTLSYERRRSGAIVGGWKLSARAVKKAFTLGLPLDAVVRIADQPEDEWATHEGVSNVIRARCDYAATCSVADKTILSVTERITAMHSAFKQDEGRHVPDDVTAIESDGVVIRGGALARVRAKTLSVEEIVRVATGPEQIWPGNRKATEVRLGPAFALIVDLRDGAVVASTTRANALKYRHGTTHDGIRIIGSALFAAAEQQILEQQLVDVVRNSQRRYRAPGRGEMVYVGDEFGVVRSDADGTIIGIVPPGDIGRHIATGTWVKVDVTHAIPEGGAPRPQRQKHRPANAGPGEGREARQGGATQTKGSPGSPKGKSRDDRVDENDRRRTSTPSQRNGGRGTNRQSGRQRPQEPVQQLAPEIVDGIRMRGHTRNSFNKRGVTEPEVIACLTDSNHHLSIEQSEDGPKAVYVLGDLKCVIRNGYLVSVTRPSQALSALSRDTTETQGAS